MIPTITLARYTNSLESQVEVECTDGTTRYGLADASHPIGAALIRDGVTPAAWVDPVSLDDHKAAALAAVDVAAGNHRSRFITTVPGQEMTYLVKAQQAADVLAGETNPTAVPLIAGEVGITGANLTEVATIVNAMHQAWLQLGAAIEATRLASKQAVRDATTKAAVDAVVAGIVWPEPT